MSGKTHDNNSISFGRAAKNLSDLDFYMENSGFGKDYKLALSKTFPTSVKNGDDKNYASPMAFVAAYRNSIVTATREVLSLRSADMTRRKKEAIGNLVKANNPNIAIREPSFEQTADDILSLKLKPVIHAQMAKIRYNLFSKIGNAPKNKP